MNTCLRLPLVMALWTVTASHAGEVVFREDFNGRLAEGWSWLREDPKGWRVVERGLELRVQPGNMWGAANNARNVLVRSAPNPAEGEVEVSVNVTNQPTAQYEQVNLVWYYDDGHMVKLGQELVDGKLCIVMGREAADKTRTIAIVPLKSFAVRLRFRVTDLRISGDFRPLDSEHWQTAGECDLPVRGEPKVSLQCYQGSPQAGHWARITDFAIRQTKRGTDDSGSKPASPP